MSKMILKNAYLIDPVNNINGRKDLEISDGLISKVSDSLDTDGAQKVYDLDGKLCIPGIIDTHVHLTLDGSNLGYHMLAKAGVTTALDMYGPPEIICENLHQYGTGINIASLTTPFNGVDTFSYQDFDESSIRKFIKEQMGRGAFGIKLIGGHYPMSPELTGDFIRIANEEEVYIAFHVGTTVSGSNIEGLKEAIALGENQSFHIAHVNSYCRGQVYESLEEVQIAINLLKTHPNLISESYLSPYNGTSGRCANGKPLSEVTSKCLSQNGYSDSQEGLETAILEGVAFVIANIGEEKIYIKNPEEALRYYRKKKGEVYLSFAINKVEAGFLLATAKNDSGEFVVPAISTDGGEIPRNVIVEKGLQLVKFGALTLEEFVVKTSVNPAKMLGLTKKGSLGVGSDADITVIDIDKEVPVMAMVMGEIIMHKGLVVGKGGRIITTEQGREYIQSKNIEPYVVNMTDTLLYK